MVLGHFFPVNTGSRKLTSYHTEPKAFGIKAYGSFWKVELVSDSTDLDKAKFLALQAGFQLSI